MYEGSVCMKVDIYYFFEGPLGNFQKKFLLNKHPASAVYPISYPKKKKRKIMHN